jgi:hypothetical protein
VENLLRQHLNPVEEAESLQRLMDDHAHQKEQLATIIGKAQSTSSRSLLLNRLPKEIGGKFHQDPTVPRNVLVDPYVESKVQLSPCNQLSTGLSLVKDHVDYCTGRDQLMIPGRAL